MKRQKLAITIGTAALLLTGTAAYASTGTATAHHSTRSAEPTKKQILALFDRWNATLATGDADKVADLYAPDGVLLPTVSPKIRTTHAEIEDYFEHFLENKPVGKKDRSVVDILDKNTAVDAGLYTFTLTDPDTGVKREVKARYTYLYEKIGGKWLIVNHHSSVLPAAS
ncbi:SgcJ/EcaC family oxidoreductase [Streptomyces sp. NBC_01537]|uniref:SgcJ/EcaC family oxidoreductase n=1 Tax=Streptomyces sp. NBC_01537 TaxID=2903896 RepID=UPI00386CF868